MVRLLFLASVEEILTINCRYHGVPSFGYDAIQCFANNCSEMKRMAAHNFENLLQVSE